jgi:hypothetical protein
VALHYKSQSTDSHVTIFSGDVHCCFDQLLILIIHIDMMVFEQEIHHLQISDDFCKESPSWLLRSVSYSTYRGNITITIFDKKRVEGGVFASKNHAMETAYV